MQQTTNYNLLIPEGTDVVNPLTQVNPNFQTIDGAMFANKQATIGTASEVVTGTIHAIIRNNPDSDVFRFTATGAWTAGDTMTLDGQQVTVHLSDGTTPATNSYIIGAEVLAMVNGSLVTLAISTTPPAQGVTSFNSRTGAVVPAASDYDASLIDYDNTGSGLTATDTQSAIDEVAGLVGAGWTLGGAVTTAGITLPASYSELVFAVDLNNVGVILNIHIVKAQLSQTTKSFRSGYYADGSSNGYAAVDVSDTNAALNTVRLNGNIVTTASTCTYYYK